MRTARQHNEATHSMGLAEVIHEQAHANAHASVREIVQAALDAMRCGTCAHYKDKLGTCGCRARPALTNQAVDVEFGCRFFEG